MSSRKAVVKVIATELRRLASRIFYIFWRLYNLSTLLGPHSLDTFVTAFDIGASALGGA